MYTIHDVRSSRGMPTYHISASDVREFGRESIIRECEQQTEAKFRKTNYARLLMTVRSNLLFALRGVRIRQFREI